MYPIHPAVTSQIKELSFNNIHTIDPVDHITFCDLLAKCRYVITDSGGVQEEASFYKKRIVVCREETERAEAADFIIKAKTPLSISSIINTLDSNTPEYFTVNKECPFGHGDAAKKITKILYERYSHNRIQ